MNQTNRLPIGLVEDAYKQLENTLKRVRANNPIRADSMMIENKPAPIQVHFNWGPASNFPMAIGSEDADEFRLVSTAFIDRDSQVKSILDRITDMEKDEMFRKVQYAVMQHALGFNPIKPNEQIPFTGWSISTSIWHIDDPQFMHDTIMKMVSAQSAAMSLFQDFVLEYKRAFQAEKQIEG